MYKGQEFVDYHLFDGKVQASRQASKEGEVSMVEITKEVIVVEVPEESVPKDGKCTDQPIKHDPPLTTPNTKKEAADASNEAGKYSNHAAELLDKEASVVELEDEEVELAKSLWCPSPSVLSFDAGASHDGDATNTSQAKNAIDFEDEFESDSQVDSKRGGVNVEPEERRKLTKKNF
ncbi:hypothetical protein JAAARDRAFT_189573 [Jaapia argillacea MUCL 33604]|uniref:Uncharacterized protein n=1 Tax=Jaapia argillacea MUCL 33604 TaxID=933084 RepID=A0A067QHZ2_9AGAM|nr:hypothetical protein JAAARDRAFT_189573 [Jaapia argillacea MUCL 33604]